MKWLRWHRQIELLLLGLALIVLGAVYFSRITPVQQRKIELEAGLEQLYMMEQAHFEQYGTYFDPTDPAAGLDWQWMEQHDWEFRAGESGFWLLARADLDGDGVVGVWGVDHRGPQVRRLMED